MPTLLYHHSKVADAGEPQELIRQTLMGMLTVFTDDTLKAPEQRQKSYEDLIKGLRRLSCSAAADDVESMGRKDTHDGEEFLAAAAHEIGGDAQRLSRPRAECVLLLVLAQQLPLW